MDNIEILGIKLHPVTHEEALLKLKEFSVKEGSYLVCTPNVEFVVKAQKDSEFYDILNNYSALNLVDGVGLLWASRFLAYKSPTKPVFHEIITTIQWILSLSLLPLILKYTEGPIPEKISGSDFILSVCRFAADNKLKVFLLGGAPTVAERTALHLQTDIFNLRIAGVHSGTPKETRQIIDVIKKSKADILLVAFGAPKQEKWLRQNLEKTGCKIGIGLGGSFDFIAGVRKRAPLWVRRAGFEWLYRLIQEPKRFYRQLALPKFALTVLVAKLTHRPIFKINHPEKRGAI
ncbi:MAG: putative N-acetylmannosaminyltransferase [bacterium ADurb.Bin400]|nr:MAG: putative N-acetylmannosaminyltransferase [bacterium ADurb.Bin400]